MKYVPTTSWQTRLFLGEVFLGWSIVAFHLGSLLQTILMMCFAPVFPMGILYFAPLFISPKPQVGPFEALLCLLLLWGVYLLLFLLMRRGGWVGFVSFVLLSVLWAFNLIGFVRGIETADIS